jgi:uncharacterized phage protein gp47/JayE
MPIITKTLQEVQQMMVSSLLMSVNTGQTDIKKQIDPNIRNSLIGGLVSSLSAGIDDNNQLLKQILKQLFPQTATDEYLKFWGEMLGLSIKTSQKASGYINLIGTASTQIPTNTILQKADGTEYDTLATTVIATQSINITSLIRVGTTATATTSDNHNLASGMQAIVAGANQADYNITTTITATDYNKFTYQVANAPTTPATGSINATATFARVQVLSRELGTIGNATNGSQLELVSPIENVDNFAFVAYEGLTGGLDAETEDNYRARVLYAWANNTASFTNAKIQSFLINNIPAITRVWVYDATPSAGYVSIYFVNDKEINILPNSTQLAEAKLSITDTKNGGIKPANTDDTMVLVLSPQPVYIDFTFSSLTPNTAEMRQAITDRLTDYFKSVEVSLGKDISDPTYKNVIFSTVDSQGKTPTFTLSQPSGAIDVSSNQLPILRNITF